MSNAPMTAFAQAALAVSDLLAARFASTKFGGSIPRVLKVQAPQGPSTSGGKNARESLVLMPESGDTQQAITVGFVDVALRAVELRTFDALAGPYLERFGRVLDIPRAQYDAFVAELKAFLVTEGYVFKFQDASDLEAKALRVQRAEEAVAKKSGGVPTVAIAAIVAIVVIGVAAIVFMMR